MVQLLGDTRSFVHALAEGIQLAAAKHTIRSTNTSAAAVHKKDFMVGDSCRYINIKARTSVM
jgi:hypothetical protein